jgi:diadenosine tetraphosphate (Ap4A) HIT family hydrolase
MASLFTQIIEGSLPGHFVYSDEQVAAFLSIAPVTAGHTLVVPRQELDQWTDASPSLLAHCVEVAQRIGVAQKRVWDAPRAGLIIAGFEVAHLHLHVFAMWGLGDLELTGLPVETDGSKLAANAALLRAALEA